jgi:outer membrane receptor protein involved in Fe transport
MIGRLRHSLLVCLAAAALPASGWEGQLVDPSGAPLAGARISVVGRTGQAVTDPAGQFELPDAARPPLTLFVELDQEKAVAVTVPALARTGRTVVVADPALFQAVEIWAAAAPDLEAAPGALSGKVDAAAAAARGDTNVQQALVGVPGTGLPVPDPDQVPALRGLGRGRTLFVIDGAPVAAERRAGFSGGQAHTGTWGELEIARGPNGILYGSSAIGGIIALDSPWAPPDERERLSATLEARAGGTAGGAGALLWQHDGFSVAAGLREATDPTAADGTELEGEYRQQSLFAGRSWRGGRTLYRLGVRGDRLADAERLLRKGERLQRTPEDRIGRASFRADRLEGDVHHSVVAWLGDAVRETLVLTDFTVDDPSGDPRDVPVELRSRTEQREAGVRWTLGGAAEKVSWSAGGQLSARFDVATETAAGAPAASAPLPDELAGLLERVSGRGLADGRAVTGAVFGLASRPIAPRLNAHLGLRVERIDSAAELAGRDVDRAAWATAGSAALSWQAFEHGSLVLQTARGYREPLLTERYLNGITGRGIVFDNTDLDPERSEQIDLAWRQRWGRTRWELATFRYRIRDVVVREDLPADELPAGFDPGSLRVYRFVNRGTADIDGIEVATSIALPARIRLDVAAHRLRGEDGTGEALSGLPADTLTLMVRRPIGARARAGLTAVFRGRDDELAGGEVPRSGYALFDLDASVVLRPGLELRGAVRNLLDREYPTGADPDDPPGPGRTFVLALTLTR